ncbi:hypothetical protein EVG20_g8821, partial [Dentipellis fragilis]
MAGEGTITHQGVAIPGLDMSLYARRRQHHLTLPHPINKLPPELLAYIFISVSEIDPPTTHGDDDQHSVSSASSASSAGTPEGFNLGWIVVTQICGFWRTVAVCHPRLWVDISPALTWSWAQVFLQRSRAVNLHIVRNVRIGAPEVLDIAAHIKHIAELDITACPPLLSLWNEDETDIDDLSFDFLKRPAPCLRKLALREGAGIIWCNYVVFHNLLAGDAPCLREVTLHVHMIPWDSRIFQNLTSLEIVLPEAMSYIEYVERLTDAELRILPPTLTQLVTIFAACASTLEVCKLDLGVLLLVDSQECNVEGLIHLEHLTTFDICMLPTNFAMLFDCIEVAPTAKFGVTLWGARNDNDYLAILPGLKRHVARNSSASNPFTALLVDIHAECTQLEVIFQTDSEAGEEIFIRMQYSENVEGPEGAKIIEWLNSFFATIPLETITRLCFPIKKMPGQWDSFNGFPYLSAVHVLNVF